MPLYEYRCLKCGQQFEVIQKFSDEPLMECDPAAQECDGGGQLERLLSAPSIQFKGSGWYITDYARSKQNDSKSAESKEAGEKKESKKSETQTKKSDKTETKSKDSKKSSD